MIRELRPALPGLRAIYGLTKDEIVAMPANELAEFVRQFDKWTSVVSGGTVQSK